MNSIIKTDPNDEGDTAAPSTGKNRSGPGEPDSEEAAIHAELSKRIGWLRRKAKLYIGKDD